MSYLQGEAELVGALDRLSVSVITLSEAWCSEGMDILKEIVETLAPVGDGPEHLRDSFVTDGPWPAAATGMTEGRVYPTRVYGRRVDRGFHGLDSLGRYYDQQGDFYMERAVTEAEPLLAALWGELALQFIVSGGAE